MDTLTHSEFKTLLINNLKGSTIISMRAETKAKINKGTGASAMVETIGINPDHIIKYTDRVGLINNSNVVTFEDFVNNRLVKEAKAKGKKTPQLKFTAGPRTWGTRSKECPVLVEHDGKIYMTIFCVTNNKPKVTHKYEGEVIDLQEARFDAYRSAEKKSKNNQGTEKAVDVRDYTMSNVKQVTIFKKTYNLIPDA